MAQSIPGAPWGELAPGAASLTEDDLLALPYDPNWRYELVEGRLLRMPPTGGEHSSISGNLHIVLGHWVLTHHLGTVQSAEAGFRLTPLTVLAADVSFVQAGRAATLTPEQRKRYWPFAPDLVAEVVSPSQTGGAMSKAHADMEAKARAWVNGGVRLVWLVWPDTEEVAVWRMDANATPSEPRQIALLSRANGDALDGLDVLPGFTYPLADLFTLDY